MATEVVIPLMGLTVEKGTILSWLKAEGERVEKGEPLFEVETDKVTVEVESPDSGILRKILVPQGVEVPVLTVVAVITAADEELPQEYLAAKPAAAAVVPAPPQAAEARPQENMEVRAAPAARKLASEHGIDLWLVSGSGPEGTILKKDVEDYIARLPAREEVKASPLARKLAQDRGVELAAVEGTGVRGRIMKRDVLAALGEEKAAPGFGEIVPMSRMRKTIARRISQSAFTAPHVYFFTDVDMLKLNELRAAIVPEMERRFHVRISVNDFLIKAVALAITEHPLLNATVDGEQIRILPRVNIGLAVALDEGLIVPVIPDADKLGLGEIAVLRDDLVSRARAGKLKPSEIEGGTFTVSNLAQFDITLFTAILNPPESGILTVGKVEPTPVVVDGQITIRPLMNVGLSVDHRIIDGALAAAFLQNVKRKLEQPYVLLLSE